MANYFTDRSVENPGRYRLTPTGTNDVYDLTREEGDVYNPGTPLNAENLNDAMQEVIDQIPTEADYVIEQGTSGIWTYRKWNSGVAECWGKGTISGTWTAWGSVYHIEKTFDYPFAFASVPVVQAFSQAQSVSGVSSSIMSVGSYIGLTDTALQEHCNVALLRATAGTNNATYPCDIYAIGRWK